MTSRRPTFRASAWFAGAKLLLLLGLTLAGFQCGAEIGYWMALPVYALLATRLWHRAYTEMAEEFDLDVPHGLLLTLELGCELYLSVHEAQSLNDPTLLFLLTATFSGFLYRFWGALPVSLAFAIGSGLLSLVHGIGVLHFTALDGLDGGAILSRWALPATIGFFLSILTAFLSSSLRSHRIALIGTSQALELARLDMDAVVNSIASGVLVFDDTLRLLYSNEPAASHFPATIHPGKPLAELVEGETWGQGVLEGCRMVLQGGLSWDLEATGRHQEILLFQASGHWARGKLRILVLTLQDITSLRHMEAEVRSAERMATLGNVAAQIAHEIRNPLASISGSAELLEGVQDLGDEDRRLLELIREESARLNRTLQEFLDFSRLKPPSLRRIPLRPLLEKVRLFLLQRPESQCTPPPLVQLECSPTLEIHTDSDLLLQILQNLALNGLQAVPSDRRSELKLLAKPEKQGTIEITVSDNGIGMSKSILERAGDVFFTTKSNGNGLGLAVSKQLVASLGGELVLDSVPGTGTNARLVLIHVAEGSL